MQNIKTIILLILISTSFKGLAQTEMLNIRPDDDTAIGKSGPNLKNFFTYFISYGQTVGPSEAISSRVKYGVCPYWSFGYRYKLKFNSSFSTGFEFQYNQYSYGIKQSTTKSFPDSILHNKEKLRLYTFSLSPYLRFNFDRHRGNYIGYFIDLGAFADLNFIKQHIASDKLDDGTLRKISITRLKYIEPYRYGLYAQLGLTKYVFFCNYFLSDIFTSKSGYAELPRFIVGIKLSLH